MTLNKVILGVIGVAAALSLYFSFTLFTQRSQPVMEAGATPGQIITSTDLTVGGLRSRSVKTPFNLATTTICSIKSPEATSTLVYASVNVKLASSTDNSIVDIARSTNTGATTTIIGTTYNILAGAQATIVASTTATAATTVVFPPNNYMVVNMKGGSINYFSPTGSGCSAVWMVN